MKFKPDIPDGWIKDAFAYATSKSKAPDSIVFWSLMSLCGASLRDKVKINMASKPIYPNIPLLIVAPSGRGKTSTLRVLEPVFDGCLPYQIPEDCTAESAIKYFAEYGTRSSESTSTIWITPEMADIFGKKDYQKGMIARITRLLDCPKNREVGRKGDDESIIIKGNALLNWIAGTTIDWLVDHVDSAVSVGGFLPRLYVVNTEEMPKYVDNPEREIDRELELNKRLKTILKEIKSETISMTDYMKEYIKANLVDLENATNSQAEPFISRRDENTFKLFVLLWAFHAKYYASLTQGSYACLTHSKNLYKYIEYNNISLTDGVLMRKFVHPPSLHKVVKKLRNHEKKTITYAKICRDLRMNTEVMKPIARYLNSMGYITWNLKFGEAGSIFINSLSDFENGA